MQLVETITAILKAREFDWIRNGLLHITLALKFAPLWSDITTQSFEQGAARLL
jgi:hypothetical protein